MTMLMVVLAEDFLVHCAPDKMVSAAQAQRGDGIFANAADVFQSGFTGESGRGTCVSLPVLDVAVGQIEILSSRKAGGQLQVFQFGLQRVGG